MTNEDRNAIKLLNESAAALGLDLRGGKIRRTSSRFCLGVEHGDYNGTELFGVGTDRFIWLAYRPRPDRRVRLASANFPDEGLVEFELGRVPPPLAPEFAHAWARFPWGVEWVLRQGGYPLSRGFDAVLYGNIPGGGLSRSASLTINLLLTFLEASSLKIDEPFRLIDLAQQVENAYIGSPCGQLDQIMIYFARAGMGTHYNPARRTIGYLPLGADADFRIVVMDTGTLRPGLEKSTYKIRRQECEDLTALLKNSGYPIDRLADIRDESPYREIMDRFGSAHPAWCRRLDYIYHAQKRFYQMLAAWQGGDMETVGRLFREDGSGLRDDYQISGPELESMCDIARTVPGVLGERMLGGGDKGASGALVRPSAIEPLRAAIAREYPRRHPEYATRFAVHVCAPVPGVVEFPF